MSERDNGAGKGTSSGGGMSTAARLRMLEAENTRLRAAMCAMEQCRPTDWAPIVPEILAPGSDGASVCAYVICMDTYEVLYVNEAVVSMLGDCVGQRCHEVLQGRSEPCPFCNNDKLREFPDTTQVWEHRNERLGRWYRCFDRAMTWMDGRLARYELAVDITERREMENELVRFRAALDASAEAIFLVDPENGVCVDVSRGACNLLGYDRDELLQLSPAQLDASLSPARLRTLRRILRQGGGELAGVETTYRHKDGSFVPVEVNARSSLLADGRVIAAIVARGITEQVRTRKALELRCQYEHVLATCARELLAQPCTAESIARILETLRATAGACRASIYENHEDEAGQLQSVRRYERLAPGVWSVSENADIPKSLHAQRAPHFYRLLREGKAAYGVLSSLSGPEKVLLQGMGVKSVLALPIVVRGHWHGIIAFSDTRNERAWQPGDIAFLQTAGEIIGAALERSQTELSLAESHQRAEEASRAKSLFLATMSHEVRTPLNAIIGLTELSLQEPVSPTVKENLRGVLTSGEALLGIVNDVLDISRVEAGRLHLECMDFSPVNLARGIVRMFQGEATRKGLELHLHLDRNLPAQLRGDAGRVRQVMVNLLGNALKFTEEGGVHVSIRCGASEAEAPGASLPGVAPDNRVWLRFTVRDTGIGIPLEKQASIFEEFAQADETITRRFGGTGLGLAICRRFVELMGGSIELDSLPGQGSVFWYDIPFQPAMQGQEVTGPGDVPAEQTLHVLVIDPAEVNRRALMLGISRKGHVAHGASGVEGAMDQLARQSFDLVVCALPFACPPAGMVEDDEATIGPMQMLRLLREGQCCTPQDVPVVAVLDDRSMSCVSALRELAVQIHEAPLRLRAVQDMLDGVHDARAQAAFGVEEEPAPFMAEPPVLLPGGEDAMMETYRVRFLRQVPTVREGLWSAMDRGSRVELFSFAGLLKYQADVMGAARLHMLAARLEARAGAGTTEAARPVFLLLVDALNQLEHELKRLYGEA